MIESEHCTFRVVRRYAVCIALILTGMGTFPRQASAAEQCQGKIVAHVVYSRPLPEDDLHLTLTLLYDADDVLARITALQEASKPALEPLIKEYMYVAEMLNRLSLTGSDRCAQFRQQFTDAETRIDRVLAGYRQQIQTILDEAEVMSDVCASLTADCLLSGVVPGKYRLFVELSFSTTTLRWFEPVEVEGGDSVPVLLTRDNLNNPYWTDLNWWSFMNLDFSKHH